MLQLDPLSVCVDDTPVILSKLQDNDILYFSNYDLKNQLLAYYSRHKISVDESDMDYRIRCARKAEVRGHTYKGMTADYADVSKATFAKVSLTVDQNANRGTMSEDVNGYGTFFGTTLLFFRHIQNGISRIFCLLEIFLNTSLSVGGVPFGTKKDTKFYVMDITRLDCAVHRLPYLHDAKKHYYIHQGMVPEDIELGKRKKI